MNKQFDYLKESERTLSDKFYGSEVKSGYLKAELINFSNAANNLDRIKKGLFYGKNLADLPKGPFNLDWAKGHKDILHAVIGIATEAGEIVDAYSKFINDESELDVVNLCEEVGDILWYAAIICREAGVSFEDIQRNNIEKLAKRFPDKFTEFNANNRDLAGERLILEKIEQVGLVATYAAIQQGSVELPQSIEPEVSCISKAKLIEALDSEHLNDKEVRSWNSTTEMVDYIFKNFA